MNSGDGSWRRDHRPKPPKCPSGKVAYRDQLGAKLALAKLQGQGKRSWLKAEARAYRCDRGNHWHLTSKEGQRGAPPRDV